MKRSFDTPVLCPVLIGRTEMLSALCSLTDEGKNGNGAVALVSGEAGIGKSRLVAEVKSYAAAQDFLLMQGKCFPTDLSCPYAPLLDLLHTSLTSHAASLPAQDIEALAQIFHPLLPALDHLLVESAPPSSLPPLDPEHEKRRRFETLAHFFTRQATARPLLLVVEDLHWSDDTSLEFHYYLARHISARSLLLQLTYRSDE